jgi:hypothetical protein
MKYTSLFVVALCVPAAGTAMPTGEFITRWQAASRVSISTGLTPEQIAASPELKALFAEFSTAARSYQQQVLSARTAGTQPRACPPKDVNLSVDGVIADLKRLPAGWQSSELSDTFAAAMDRRYPCTAGAAQ